jgi:ribosomal protein L11 methyltransferase
MSDRLVRVSFRVAAARAEEARAAVIALASNGFEEREDADGLELSVYAAPDEAVELLASLEGAVAEPVAAGWEDAWRAFHRPVVAGGVWIGPPWERTPEDLPAVVIDPGRAFGTGAHATTRLCVELLSRTERGSLLDVGCGSGVLSLAASRLGFAPVIAIDNDDAAIEVTRANAVANGVALDVQLADASATVLPRTDVAVANILLSPVTDVLGRLPAQRAVTSGYLVHDRPAAPRWRHVERVEADGWAADRWTLDGGRETPHEHRR